jgi:hypothetical protein
MAGATYVVGEKGPELFTPGASGAISPHGGMALTQNFNVEAVQPTLEAQLAVMTRIAAQAAGDAVMAAMSGRR